MIRCIPFLPTIIAGCLAACSTGSPRVVAQPVRAGMTSAELLSAFGRPLRVQHQANGGEDWFYNFGSQRRESRPISESASSETERSYSVGQANTITTTINQAPVHLSPAGRVVGLIPPGNVIVE